MGRRHAFTLFVAKMSWCQGQHSSKDQKKWLDLSLVAFDTLMVSDNGMKMSSKTVGTPASRFKSVIFCGWSISHSEGQ